MTSHSRISRNFGLLAAAALVILASGCAQRRFPGTEIEDNSDTRAIRDVMLAYINALENKDAGALLGLVSEKFADNSGTAEPDDDLNYEVLKAQLPERFKRLSDIRVEMELRRIHVEGDAAVAVYFYNLRYRMPGINEKPQLESDLKQMNFAREGEGWKITSGI